MNNNKQIRLLLARVQSLEDTNEALKAEVAALKETAEGDDIAHRGLVKLYDKAEAERDRLREALEWLVKLKKGKDSKGKSAGYLSEKESAWDFAGLVLDPGNFSKQAINHKEG